MKDQALKQRIYQLAARAVMAEDAAVVYRLLPQHKTTNALVGRIQLEIHNADIQYWRYDLHEIARGLGCRDQDVIRFQTQVHLFGGPLTEESVNRFIECMRAGGDA